MIPFAGQDTGDVPTHGVSSAPSPCAGIRTHDEAALYAYARRTVWGHRRSVGASDRQANRPARRRIGPARRSDRGSRRESWPSTLGRLVLVKGPEAGPAATGATPACRRGMPQATKRA
ncbi:protein of unknown function [Methylorubrum extorquens]|uniref:Uncharacterized protein n=1 Tax=Methylorubrum extorquens TaxID=408 RepID=A0A2N9ASH2_METEX|nr:protein of unknown function [Methylorubrum extorquens]